MNYKVIPADPNTYGFGRFVIINEETENIIDDAQGYGYKTMKNAIKAGWYKFKKGKEKLDKQKQLYNNWKKENKQIDDSISGLIEGCFKELARGETRIEEIFEQVEKHYNVELPDYVKKEIIK